MSQKYILICRYYKFNERGVINVEMGKLGEFDTHEDALWKQIMLQEEFISIMNKNPYLKIYLSPQKINRNVDDIVHILDHHPYSEPRKFDKAQELIKKHPVLTHKEYYIFTHKEYDELTSELKLILV
jgi:hypothetical protein